MVGLQAGVIVGKPNRVFVIGVDGRYAPYSEEQWKVGLSATYYVPFFDFN